MFKVFPRSFSSSNTNTSFTYLMRSEGVTAQNGLADGIVNNSQLFVWHDYAASSASWEKVNVKGIFNPTAEHYQELVFNIFMPGWKGRVTWVIWLHLLCRETIWQYNEEGQVKTRLHSPGKKKKNHWNLDQAFKEQSFPYWLQARMTLWVVLIYLTSPSCKQGNRNPHKVGSKYLL